MIPRDKESTREMLDACYARIRQLSAEIDRLTTLRPVGNRDELINRAQGWLKHPDGYWMRASVYDPEATHWTPLIVPKEPK